MSSVSPTCASKSAPLLIENVYEKETFESFIERHFRLTGLHRCRSTGEYDLEAVVSEHSASLIRSAQELEPNPNGKGFRPFWTSLVFQPQPLVFWHFVIKNPSNYGAKEQTRQYTLTVSADSSATAAAESLKLHTNHTVSDDQPGFFLIRDLKNPQRIPLKEKYALTAQQLELHYGAGFRDWEERFAQGLHQSGLSILRGKPGTGKTSFLRHLILSLSTSHRFYYLPADAFSLLQAQMTDFLMRERKRFKDTILVLVLEDAEQLLLNRRDLRDGLASSLLNFTDGFVGDMVQAHLICTINSEVKDLDEAVLRPGRQRFFREFGLLEWDQALRLAETLGVTLVEKRPYSLAELYHFKDTQDADRLGERQNRRIGFAS